METQRSWVSLGEKGSSLSSCSVYKISTRVAQVRVDSSALERLSIKNPEIAQKKSSLTIPQDSTIEELRASLVVLLNKLLISSSSSSTISRVLSEILNSKEFDMAKIELTEGEGDFLEKSCAPLIGICSVIDNKSVAFSRVVDAVAALSCEALKATVKSFSSLDSGDKFAIEVASDLNVLPNGSKLVVGDNNEEVEAVSKIPGIHGRFRDVVKDLMLGQN
ncbi:unnamed protein product [Arabis nemorensis]|uniref:Uncharacterized protein n=1 Tax=Arabis nemorensis TaxID=586526 RepID=A0A565BY70_9BRAS|nr:unnamed protein product [Arabis nemorensis]